VAICEGVCLVCVAGACQMVPNSPGLNVRHEQKPSEDDISNIEPSLLLQHLSVLLTRYRVVSETHQLRSVNVA